MSERATVKSAEPDGDPYVLDPSGVVDPPTTLRGRFRHLGPGLLISASVVGSGELILTTTLGAQAGFALLWMVVLATTVKVWVQMELATWTILTGKTAIQGYSQVGRRWRGASWINVVWILAEIPSIMKRGALIGGSAAAGSLMYPIVGESLSGRSLVAWSLLITGVTIVLLLTNKYKLIERFSTASVVLFTLATVVLALALPLTPFGYSGGDLVSGLQFAIPAGTLGIAIAMFGITGVGADEMTAYTVWCIEKGYAKFTGPNDGTEAWAERARGWIRVMRVDILVSWLITTGCTLGFYIIGAAVLHPQALVPSGNEVISTLSRMYTDTLGTWANGLFLVAAFVILFSTAFAVGAANTRLWADTLARLGVYDFADQAMRNKVTRILIAVIPTLWMVAYLFVQSPVLMLQIGGTATAVFLVAVVISVWKLRSTEVPKEFRSSTFLTTMLALSSIAILLLGAYTLYDTFS
ncbi:Nramp family divalent metal transporter [Pseudonocardia nematodicida]|uniref:Nramp family divalent metal transporter n=1 Tax=Pseudonocardia nematodicida TaxID=1206997 RepID=A0ABV1KB24_9PSEU